MYKRILLTEREILAEHQYLSYVTQAHLLLPNKNTCNKIKLYTFFFGMAASQVSSLYNPTLWEYKYSQVSLVTITHYVHTVILTLSMLRYVYIVNNGYV